MRSICVPFHIEGRRSLDDVLVLARPPQGGGRNSVRIVTDTPDRERTVMSERDAFDRVLASVPDVTLDETRWPATSALIDEACGLSGNGLMVGEGPKNDVRGLFVGLYYRGQRREDLEREHLEHYHALDERVGGCPDLR